MLVLRMASFNRRCMSFSSTMTVPSVSSWCNSVAWDPALHAARATSWGGSCQSQWPVGDERTWILKASLMLDKVSARTGRRCLNVHYTMPPEIRAVQLMTGTYMDDIVLAIPQGLDSVWVRPSGHPRVRTFDRQNQIAFDQSSRCSKA